MVDAAYSSRLSHICTMLEWKLNECWLFMHGSAIGAAGGDTLLTCTRYDTSCIHVRIQACVHVQYQSMHAS